MQKTIILSLILCLTSCTNPNHKLESPRQVAQEKKEKIEEPPKLEVSLGSTVVISDSHGAGRFGTTFDHALKEAQLPYIFFASGGSAPYQWLAGGKTTCGFRSNPETTEERSCQTVANPPLAKLLPANTSIIILGTNIPVRTQAEIDEQTGYIVSLLLKAYEQSEQCIWVGPPNLNRTIYGPMEKKYEVIQNAIAKAPEAMQKAIAKANKAGKQLQYKATQPCVLIDSRKFTHYPVKSTKADGIHYNWPRTIKKGDKEALANQAIEFAASDEWAYGVVKAINKIGNE